VQKFKVLNALARATKCSRKNTKISNFLNVEIELQFVFFLSTRLLLHTLDSCLDSHRILNMVKNL